MTETSQKYRFYPKGWGKNTSFQTPSQLLTHLSGWNISVASERKGAGQQEQEQQAARADLLQPQDHPASSQQQGEAFKIGLKMGHVMSLCLQSLHLSFNVAQNNSLIIKFSKSPQGPCGSSGCGLLDVHRKYYMRIFKKTFYFSQENLQTGNCKMVNICINITITKCNFTSGVQYEVCLGLYLCSSRQTL